MKKTIVALLLTIAVVGFVGVLGGCMSKEEREKAKQRKEDSLYVGIQIEHLDTIPDDQIEKAIALCDQYGWSDSVLVSEKAKRAVLDGSIKKQVIGALILDVYTWWFKEGQLKGGVGNYMKGSKKLDSIARYEIDKIASEHGLPGVQFLTEAHKLGHEMASDAQTQVRALLLEVIQPRDLEWALEMDREYSDPTSYMTEEEMVKIIRRHMLETVEEVCRDSGYIPSDFQDRLETARKYF